jgi:catalase
MYFAGFTALLFSGVVTVAAQSQPYFDIYQGPTEQESIINDPSTELDYTLSGGQP